MYYDRTNDTFSVNRLAYMSDCFSYEVQHENYMNGNVIYTLLQDSGFCVSEEIKCGIIYEEQLKNMIARDNFIDRMRVYCEYRMKQESNIFAIPIEQMERKYRDIKPYYDELGGERIRALGYRKAKLDDDIRNNRKAWKIGADLTLIFKPGMKLPTPEIKRIIKDVYGVNNINGNPKITATVLMRKYNINIKPCKVPSVDGKRVSGYEII